MKHIVCYLVLSLVALLVPTEVGLACPPQAGEQAQPLEKFLNPDGTLHTPTGFSGSLDPKGWRMHTGPTGATTKSLCTLLCV